ncbi:M23 family metallopeptidase [Trichothermofontia sichuanensis B231]|uniref:M23 family metallopeptidase n=1 Tax=Trichothermofontia sichuanensis TaxID=3045816 RepID=UPI002245E965|nr:M23 family metallopeptidase [Trichothermofontia sichuanensis]UZQ53066.1 M23 family metallopeptidase [Trichothermofontia sichuanensis B231]
MKTKIKYYTLALTAFLLTARFGPSTVPAMADALEIYQAIQATSEYKNPVLGTTIRYPKNLKVVEDKTQSRTWGFTLIDPSGQPHFQETSNEQHPVLRVSVILEPNVTEPEQAAQSLLRSFPGVSIQQQAITIGGESAQALSSVPGEHPATYIFLKNNGKVYEIISYDDLDHQGESLLSSLTFETPQTSVESLHLPSWTEPPLRTEIPGQPDEKDVPVKKEPEKTRLAPVSLALKALLPEANPMKFLNSDLGGTNALGESVINPSVSGGVQVAAAFGCADWPSWKFIQTPFSSTANGNGWSKAGPAYYGENMHKNCNSSNRLNDYHALDFPLRNGDIIYPPAAGRVIYAGWAAPGWGSLGRIVVVDLGDGYWSLSAHLSSINVSPGQTVGISTVIGRAGGSGYYRDNAWSIHLHQGIYRNARLFRDSAGRVGIYGGQSVEMHNVRYFRNGGGAYQNIYRGQSLSW